MIYLEEGHSMPEITEVSTGNYCRDAFNKRIIEAYYALLFFLKEKQYKPEESYLFVILRKLSMKLDSKFIHQNKNELNPITALVTSLIPNNLEASSIAVKDFLDKIGLNAHEENILSLLELSIDEKDDKLLYPLSYINALVLGNYSMITKDLKAFIDRYLEEGQVTKAEYLLSILLKYVHIVGIDALDEHTQSILDDLHASICVMKTPSEDKKLTAEPVGTN